MDIMGSRDIKIAIVGAGASGTVLVSQLVEKIAYEIAEYILNNSGVD